MPDIDAGVEAELVDHFNGTIWTCWILRNDRDHLHDWLGWRAGISVAMNNSLLKCESVTHLQREGGWICIMIGGDLGRLDFGLLEGF